MWSGIADERLAPQADLKISCGLRIAKAKGAEHLYAGGEVLVSSVAFKNGWLGLQVPL